METILVGVDGSEHALGAVEFAVHEAALRGAKLRIVCAWDFPPGVVLGVGMPPDLLDSYRREAEAVVGEAVALANKTQPTVLVEGKTVKDQAAHAILEAARDAFLTVVGSRGRGGFTSLLLGSVSQQVVHHSQCPVTVVPQGPCT